MKFKIIEHSIEEEIANLVPNRGSIVLKVVNLTTKNFKKLEKRIELEVQQYSLIERPLRKIYLFQLYVLYTLFLKGDKKAATFLLYLFKNYLKGKVFFGLVFERKKKEIRIGVFRNQKALDNEKFF